MKQGHLSNNRDPLHRFSDRVQYYVRYRPRYPKDIVILLQREYNLTHQSIVADVGAGTGFMAELFLEMGCTVLAIEPNDEMRSVMEDHLKQYPTFKSVNATAEHTCLPDESVDFITCAQSFHWFDQEKAKKEFYRILKPGGVVVISWNTRRTDRPFLKDYEDLLLEFSIDYQQVDHRKVTDKEVEEFFFPASCKKVVFPNRQELDFEGLKGRLLSSSYVPSENHPHFMKMLERLKEIFDHHQQDGQVSILYDCVVYHGQFK